MATVDLLLFADVLGRAKTVHFRHLYVHEHQVEGLLGQQSDGLSAIATNHRLMTHFLQHAEHDLLVHGVIFCHQDAQGAPGLADRVARHQALRRRPTFLTQNGENGG